MAPTTSSGYASSFYLFRASSRATLSRVSRLRPDVRNGASWAARGLRHEMLMPRSPSGVTRHPLLSKYRAIVLRMTRPSYKGRPCNNVGTT